MSAESHIAPPEDINWPAVVAEAFPGIVWSTDTALRITSCQGADRQRLTAGDENLCGTSLFELFGTEDLSFPPIEAHRAALRGERVSLCFALRGTSYRGLVAPLHCDGRIVGCVTTAFELAAVDAQCEAIAHTTADLVLFLRPDGTINEINRTASGSEREYVIGKNVLSYAPPDARERLQEAMKHVLETGELVTLEVFFPRRFDNPAWQAMRIGPLRGMGRITGLVLLARDVTEQKRALEKLEDEEALLRDLLDLQDRERRLVACEIHDGLIQDVVGARMMVQGLVESLARQDAGVRTRLESALILLARAVNEGRRLISELRPMIIDEMGIREAIAYLVSEEEARGGLEIDFTPRLEAERFPPLLQATIFRIIREAIINARRHGHASHVHIRLTQIGQQHLIVEVQDDGSGFDPEQVSPNRYGLAGIRERARLFGGDASIESAAGRGTLITVKVAIGSPLHIKRFEQPNWTWTV